jgi:hypothetical protein
LRPGRSTHQDLARPGCQELRRKLRGEDPHQRPDDQAEQRSPEPDHQQSATGTHAVAEPAAEHPAHRLPHPDPGRHPGHFGGRSSATSRRPETIDLASTLIKSLRDISQIDAAAADELFTAALDTGEQP